MLERLTMAKPMASLVSYPISAVRFARNSLYPAPPALNWLQALNNIYPSEVRIRRVLDREPVIELVDPLKVSDEAARFAFKYRTILTNNGPVAVYAPPTAWADDPVVLRAHPTDYAAVCALDESGQRPAMLSGSVLLYCRDTEELILHRRSKVSRDYAGYLHTFGGAYIPPGDHIRDYDHRSLVRAARRETNEECGIGFDLSKLPNLLLGEELKIGFVSSWPCLAFASPKLRWTMQCPTPKVESCA